MGLFRSLFPLGIWVAGVILWGSAAVVSVRGELASAKPRPAVPASAARQDSRKVMESPALKDAFRDFVAVYRKPVECPTSSCLTLNLHFTALTPEAQPQAAGDWITELNTWFHPTRSPRYFVFRFHSWTPFEAARESGCGVVVPSSGATRESFAKAVSECADPKVVSREAINVYVTGSGRGPAQPGAYGVLNEFRPYLKVPSAELTEVTPGGNAWKLHRAMREALGLPINGGGRSPAFSASETEILLQNVDKVYNKISPNETIESMNFGE